MKRSAKTTLKTPPGVELGGDLTIRGIKIAHERLSFAMRDNSEVEVRVAEDATVDLTLVQLIEAARREKRDAGGDLTFATPAPQPLLDVLTRGGFLEAAESRRFWLGAGE